MSKFSKPILRAIRFASEKGFSAKDIATALNLTQPQIHATISRNKKNWAAEPALTSGQRAWATRMLNGKASGTRKPKGEGNDAEPKPTKVKVIQSGRIRFEIHNTMVNRVIIGKEGVVTIF